MQRVRIGITGLACVFLLVLLAAAIVGFRHEDANGNAAALASAAGNDATASEPKDPLAELGVAPGGATTTETRSPPPAKAR